jgi:signal transduction histidine kinase
VGHTASRLADLAVLDAALVAVDGYLVHPGPAARTHVAESLAAFADTAGLQGLHLTVNAPGARALSVGTGTLRRAPAHGTRSAAGVPVATYPIGAAAGDDASCAIADREDPALDVLARSLAIVVDAASARAATRAAVDRLAAVDDAARAIAGVLSMDRVLQIIVDRVRELVDARYAALGIVDAAGRIERFITSGMPRAERDLIGAPPRGRGILGVLIREGRSVRIADIEHDPRRSGFPAHHPPMHRLLGVPVTVKGRLIGDLYMTDRRDGAEFTDDDQRVIETFALHAGIAIDNARLHEQVQRLAIVEERERIGKDLHDGIIQSIYAVGLSLEDVPELMDEDADEARARVDRAIEGLDKTIRDIRNFIFGLRPELLQGMTLAAGLGALVEEFRVNTMIDAELTAHDADGEGLAPEEIGQVLIIAREALANVARHARATRAVVVLHATPDDVVVTIADNGVGFATDDRRPPAHQGLHNMRNRANGIGATLAVDSAPGMGTRIIVTLPRRTAAVSGGEM